MQRGLIRPACGFDSRPRHHLHGSGPVAQLEAQLPCKEKDAGSTPAVSTHATQLDVAQRKRAGIGNRRLGVRISPSRPSASHCEVVEVEPRLPLKQEVRVRALASQQSMWREGPQGSPFESASARRLGALTGPLTQHEARHTTWASSRVVIEWCAARTSRRRFAREMRASVLSIARQSDRLPRTTSARRPIPGRLVSAVPVARVPVARRLVRAVGR